MNKSDLLPIEKTVQQHVETHFINRKAPAFVIGVSGGPDSVGLLYILNKLDVDLHVVHINYQKRGVASQKDAALVQRAARQLKLPCKVVKVNPRKAEDQNFQQWARKVRYRIFKLYAQKHQLDGIAIAHHEDDQIETILQKLFRGSGLVNWAAMQVWDGQIFRPLLTVTKDVIIEYCKQQSLSYRTDASNLTSDYARNFLRNTWLPVIQEHFPGWRDNVLRIPGQAKIFESALTYILQDITDVNQALKRDALLALEPGLRKSVLLYKVMQVYEHVDISRSSLKQFEDLEKLQTGKVLQLTEGVQLMRDRSLFKWVTTETKPERTILITKEQVQKGSMVLNGIAFELQPYQNPDFEGALYLDVGHLQWPLTLRNWQYGDRFQPFGMQHHQSVADHLTNRKISAIDKKKALVVETFDEIICAVIFPSISKKRPPGTLAEPYKCSPETRQCLMIKCS